MSNAILRFKPERFHLSVIEIKTEHGIESESISDFYCDDKQVIKNNNIVQTVKFLNENPKKILIKSIDRISIIENSDQLFIQLTVEIIE